MHEILARLADWLENGEEVAMATVVRTSGSTPRKAGARLLVRANGEAAGTLGGGCVEADVWAHASSLLRKGGGATLHRYALNEGARSPHGMVCGGTMEILVLTLKPSPRTIELFSALRDGVDGALAISTDGEVSAMDGPLQEEARGLYLEGGTRFVERAEGPSFFLEVFPPAPTLVVVGGGHIAKALEPVAKMTGFRFLVIDDRPRIATRDRFVEADEVLVADFADGLSQVRLGAAAYIVIATRGHRYDDVALEAALRTQARYVGLVGSRRKAAMLLSQLEARGIPADRLREVRTPVGLDIGGGTPGEIAVSIMAEILLERNGGTGRPMRITQGEIAQPRERSRPART